MKAEEKQALIERLNKLAESLKWHNVRYAQDVLAAVAALTAKPVVKLPDCDFAAVSHMSGGAEDYCYGFVDGTQNAIKAIRAAGYEVQE